MMHRFIGVVLVLLSVNASAYYPAVRTISSQINGSGYLQCSVVDPQTGSSVNYTGPTNQSVTQLQSLNGIVAYTSGTGFSRYLHAVTYDPYSKSFVAFSYGILDATVPQLVVRDGMVAGYYTSGTFSGDFFALTYDPSDQGNGWQFFHYGMTTNAVTRFACSEGVAVIAFESGFQSNSVFGVMYDPIQTDWETFNRSVDPVSTLQITNATAYFTTTSGSSYYYGYNASSRDWYSGQTSSLLCKFYAAKADGYDARYCWLTDQSFGATSWFIDYGDGASAAQRSGSHQYNSVSRFGITVTISNNNGSSVSFTDSFASGNISVEEQWLAATIIYFVDGVLHLRDLPSGFAWRLVLMDAKGAMVFNGTPQMQEQADLQFPELTHGLYIVRLINQNGSAFSKKLYLN